jgi:hypothetical protein
VVNLGVGLLIAALPWLLSGVFAATDLPPILAYLLFPGRDLLVLLGVTVLAWSLLRDRTFLPRLGARLEALTTSRVFALAALALVAVISFARVPQEEKEAGAFGGDEPKYLRIAFSLLRDTDADVGSGRTETPGLALRLQQVKNLVLKSRDSVGELFHQTVIPQGHVWNAGNWTVRGLDGGLYHLQPPGLPAIVAVALGIGEAILPERDPGIYVFVLLSLFWILAARELWLLSRDLSADPLGSAIFVVVLLLSAPVFVGGYQLFPESISLLLFPWLIRRLGANERRLGGMTALGGGALSGYLLWIHPKLTLVAAFFAVIALLRPNTTRAAKAWFLVGFVLTAFTSLLYCHHISGLFRPEGLYIRQAEEYLGSPDPFSLRFLAGLIKSLAGGRDGLLVFAPILLLGFLVPWSTKRFSRSTLEMWCLFCVVWLTSAVHDGASLGSPARLMAPVAFVPAFFLVRALRGRPSANLRAGALLLFVVGCQITQAVSSDWRKNVNPYRTMFANPATNFEPSLPGNSFSEATYLVDLEKGVLLLLALFLISLTFKPAAASGPASRDFAPARFGLGVLATVVFLAFGLHWLGST